MKTEHLQIMLLVATLSACAEFEMTPPIFIPDKVPEAQNTPNAAADSPVQNEQSPPGESAADNPFNPTEEEVSQPLQRAPDLPAGANELIDGVPVEQQEEQSTPCEGLSAQGRCDGHFAVWCDNGQEARTNCADRFNTTCGLVDAETGFFLPEQRPTRPSEYASTGCPAAVRLWQRRLPRLLRRRRRSLVQRE